MTEPAPIHGWVAPGFEAVRDEFQRNFAERGEVDHVEVMQRALQALGEELGLDGLVTELAGAEFAVRFHGRLLLQPRQRHAIDDHGPDTLCFPWRLLHLEMRGHESETDFEIVTVKRFHGRIDGFADTTAGAFKGHPAIGGNDQEHPVSLPVSRIAALAWWKRLTAGGQQERRQQNSEETRVDEATLLQGFSRAYHCIPPL